jgi:hypothetical protein
MVNELLRRRAGVLLGGAIWTGVLLLEAYAMNVARVRFRDTSPLRDA